ncbi:transcription elongation factor TFIIS-like protein [Tanacetum coccineum]
MAVEVVMSVVIHKLTNLITEESQIFKKVIDEVQSDVVQLILNHAEHQEQTNWVMQSRSKVYRVVDAIETFALAETRVVDAIETSAYCGLTKHPKKKIQSLASELVEIWKGVIVEETIKNKKNGNLDIMESPKSNNTPVMSQNKVHRDNSIKAARKEEIKVENKPTINDVAPMKLTSLVYCKDPIRDKIHELLAEALRKILLGHVKPERIVESTPKEITSTERQMENVKIKEKALFDCERGAHQRLLLISLDVGDVRKGINNFFELEGAVVKSSVIHKALSHLRQLIISGQIRCRRLSVPLCA